MAKLSDNPGSSTKAQRSRLVVVARQRGIDLSELRDLVGGSVSALSSADCSAWITKLSGQDLPHPPGQAPRRKGRPAPGTVRMITQDHVDQISRLMGEYFGWGTNGPHVSAFHWLRKDFKEVKTDIRDLATAQRAGEVIRVLKSMLARTRKDS